MSVFDQELGEGRDFNPQAPIRYQIGLKSGHIISDHCGITEKEVIETNFRTDRSFKAKRNWASTYCLRGLRDYAIRANQLTYWMQIGADVMLQPFAPFKEIEIGLQGSQKLKLMMNLEIYRSLMDLFVPREIKVNEQLKQAIPVGSAMRFRLHSDDKDENRKIEWKRNVVFIAYWYDGKHYRRVRCAFKVDDLIYISQTGGSEWY